MFMCKFFRAESRYACLWESLHPHALRNINHPPPHGFHFVKPNYLYFSTFLEKHCGCCVSGWTGLFKIYLEILQERGRQWECFYLLVHFPNNCNDQNWLRLKAGARNFIWLFHWVTGTQILGPSCSVFPRQRDKEGRRERGREREREIETERESQKLSVTTMVETQELEPPAAIPRCVLAVSLIGRLSKTWIRHSNMVHVGVSSTVVVYFSLYRPWIIPCSWMFWWTVLFW